MVALTVLANVWVEVSPVLSALAIIFSVTLSGHAVFRLWWRHRHGLPTLYDPHIEKPRKP